MFSSSVALDSSLSMEFPLVGCANRITWGSVRAFDTEVRRPPFLSLLGGGFETTLRLPVSCCPAGKVAAAPHPRGPQATLLLSALLSKALMLALGCFASANAEGIARGTIRAVPVR